MPKTVNKRIADKTILHQLDLMRVDEVTRRKIIKLLVDLERDIQKQLVGVNFMGPKQQVYRQQRLAKLLKQVGQISKTAYRDINATVSGDLLELSKIESGWAVGLMDDVVGVPLGGTVLPLPHLKNIVSNTLIEGAPSKEWWAGQNKHLTDQFSKQMRMGMLEGETIREMSNRVNKIIMPTRKRQAETLVRTSFMSVAQKTRYDTFKDMDDVVKEFKWLSTLDTRTSDQCKARSGKRYTLNLQPIGHSISAGAGPGALHWNCRSAWVAITFSWKEMGAKGKAKFDTHPKMQSSLGGYVPADMNYEGWLNTQSVEIQKDALGPGKWKLWNEGKIKSVSQLVDQSGRAMTLGALSEKVGSIPYRLAEALGKP